MQTDIQEYDVPMTCRLNIFIPVSFCEHALQIEVPSRLFAL
jgi:hypothetical protein